MENFIEAADGAWGAWGPLLRGMIPERPSKARGKGIRNCVWKEPGAEVTACIPRDFHISSPDTFSTDQYTIMTNMPTRRERNGIRNMRADGTRDGRISTLAATSTSTQLPCCCVRW